MIVAEMLKELVLGLDFLDFNMKEQFLAGIDRCILTNDYSTFEGIFQSTRKALYLDKPEAIEFWAALQNRLNQEMLVANIGVEILKFALNESED